MNNRLLVAASLTIALTAALTSCAAGGPEATPTPTVPPLIALHKGVVPDLVGMGVKSAIHLARRVGFSPKVTDSNGETVYDRWGATASLKGLYICDQSYLAGSKYPRSLYSEDLSLVASQSCAGRENLYYSEDIAKKLGLFGPPKFSGNATDELYVGGWVVGYGDEEYYADEIYVRTYGGTVKFNLALIEPLSDWCSSTKVEGKLAKQALAKKHELLPIGSKVILDARLANTPDEYRAVYALSEQDALDAPTWNDSKTVNYQLVKSGTWTVKEDDFSESPSDAKPTSQKWRLDSYSDLSSLGKKYAKALAKVADKNRSLKKGLGSKCMSEKVSDWVSIYGASGGASGGGSGGFGSSDCVWIEEPWWSLIPSHCKLF